MEQKVFLIIARDLVKVLMVLFLTVASQGLFPQQTGLKTVLQNNHSADIKEFEFSPDGKMAFTFSKVDHFKDETHSENSLKIWDVKTGLLLNTINIPSAGPFKPLGFTYDCEHLVIIRSKKIIIVNTWDGMVVNELATNKYKHILSRDGKWLLTKNSPNSLMLYEFQKKGQISPLKKLRSKEDIYRYKIHPDGKYIVASTKGITIWDTESWKRRDVKIDLCVQSSIQFGCRKKCVKTDCRRQPYVLLDEKDKYFCRDSFPDFNHFTLDDELYGEASGNKLFIKKSSNHQTTSIIQGNTTRIAGASYYGEYDLVALGIGGNPKLFSLRTGKVVKFIKAEEYAAISLYTSSANGRFILTAHKDKSLHLWDVMMLQEIWSYKLNAEASCVAVDNDGKYVVCGEKKTKNTFFWRVDLNSKPKLINPGKELWGAVAASFTENGELILSEHDPETPVRKYSLPGLNIIKEYKTNGIAYALYINSSNQLATFETGGLIEFFDAKTGAIDPSPKPLIVSGKIIKYAPRGKMLLSANNDGDITMINPEAKTVIKRIKIHQASINSIDFIDDTKVLTSSDDGSVKCWDLQSGKLNYTLAFFDDDNYCILFPDNYYMASRKAFNGIHFVKNKGVYEFNNFDLVFNRPDIVMSRFGEADPKLIEAYKKAYLKRIQKMGFALNDIGKDIHLPVAKIITKNIPAEAANKTLNIHVECSDTKYKLNRLNLYVNDVPVYGINGLPIKTGDASHYSAQLEIPLNDGENKIQVSAHNEKGAESLRESVEINCKKSTPADLYILTIGVSHFVQEVYNLSYAAKDARDIINQFKKSNEFANIHELPFLNEKATKSNILAVKETLKNSKVDDMVILFVASHGLLDDDMNYYLATHDVQFYDPSDKGLPYEDLEGLLDGIPARKKLILIDACHSGEVDKDEMELADATISSGTVKARGFKAVKTKENQLGMQNSFELMKELFADLRRGTGAVVISSAGGAEYAFESEKWNNGVFTYSLLEGLQTKNADKNKDGKIMVSELRDYVIEKVQQLTNGKQNPTVRRENLEFDFRVW